VRRTGVISLTCVLLGLAVAGCNHDGRTLAPPRPDQNASISTTAAPTTTAVPDFGGLDGGDPGDSTTTIGGAPISATTAVASLEGEGVIAAGSVTAPWRDGAAIDARYTCAGADVSPPLTWSPAPDGTRQIAVTMADEQAPTFVHWAMAGLAPDTVTLTEGQIPAGAIESVNGAGGTGYTGPCPPQGQPHTYVITVHFLDGDIELGNGAAGADLLLAINANTLASAEVTGTFSRA
jgi:Raf kinase inhibitor-like YbhB/YbcL family protein